MEEINKGGISWPNTTDIGLIRVAFLNVDISFEAVFVSTAVSFDSGIDDGDVSVFLQQFVESIEWEPPLIDREIFIVDHVVNIAPKSVKRNAVFLISCGHCLEVGDVLVSPSALMESQTPERRNG